MSELVEVDIDRQPNPSPDPKGVPNWLRTLALVAFGVLVGWMVSQFVGQTDDPAEQIADTPPESEEDRSADEESAAADADSTTPATVEATTPEPIPMGPTRISSFDVLPAVGVLDGPVSLLPGLGGRTLLRLYPDGRSTMELEPTGQARSFPTGDYDGFVVAQMGDGVLFVPADQALGGIAMWRPTWGVTLPLPDAPYDTSFLAASESLGVFLSAGDLVVADLARQRTRLRVPGQVDDSPVVHACLDDSESLIALVAADGTVVVHDLSDSGDPFADAAVFRANTSTPRFGVAWTGPGQLASLDQDDEGSFLVVHEIASGDQTPVARLGGEPWSLATTGTGC